MSMASSQRELVKQLAQVLESQTASRLTRHGAAYSSGCQVWNAWLPWGGWAPGALIEWLSMQPGGGASTLALLAARQACNAAYTSSLEGTQPARAGDRSGWLAVIDPSGGFYPPAAAAWGVDLDRLIWVRPQSLRDFHWAVDQCLRSPGIASVLAWVDRVDPHTFRRWQLAAEQSGVLGCLIRPEKAVSESSWADLRLGVCPQSTPPPCSPFVPPASSSPSEIALPFHAAYERRMTLHVLHRRGGGRFRPLNLTVSHEMFASFACETPRTRACETPRTRASETPGTFASKTPGAKAEQSSARGVCLASELGHPTIPRRTAEAS